MNFSGISRTTSLGRILRHFLVIIPPNTIVPIIQGPLRGKRWIIGASVHGCWLGSYEFHKQHEFIQRVKPGQTVYDIGANVGFYTLLASELVGSTGKVFAFEPLPRNLHYLVKHINLNHLSNVEVCDWAVGDYDGSQYFDPGSNPSMGHLADEGPIQVQLRTLDGLFDAPDFSPPDILKIDVEGAEDRVLNGARNILERYSPVLFIATHGQEQNRRCISILESLGYRLESLTSLPLSETDELLATRF